jgi:lipid-A-disaccharide synthase
MYRDFESLGVTILFAQTYDLLRFSDLAVVTSGTATLETALFSVPQVVCYKGSFISYIIARNLIKIKYISLILKSGHPTRILVMLFLIMMFM